MDTGGPRDALTERVIGLGIAVHRELGPGLLESAYKECLCYELRDKGIDYSRQVPLPVSYRGVRLDCGYRLDIVVDRKVLLEINATKLKF